MTTHRELIEKANQLMAQEDKTIEEYKLCIKELEQKIQRIYYASQLVNLQDSLEALAYLVSQIEGEEYIIDDIPLTLISLNYQYSKHLVNGKFAYLVKKDRKQEARQEITKKYRIVNSKNLSESFQEQNKNLATPSENYIQLAFHYRPAGETKIAYLLVAKESFCGINESFISCSKNITAILCDDNYGYIEDYINMVLSYQLDQPNLALTSTEMQKIADDFIKDYKKVHIHSLIKRKK